MSSTVCVITIMLSMLKTMFWLRYNTLSTKQESGLQNKFPAMIDSLNHRTVWYNSFCLFFLCFSYYQVITNCKFLHAWYAIWPHLSADRISNAVISIHYRIHCSLKYKTFCKMTKGSGNHWERNQRLSVSL